MSDTAPAGTAFAAAAELVRQGDQDPDAAASGLIAQLTDDELLWLLDGDQTLRQALPDLRAMTRGDGVPLQAGRIDRLGIPGIRFTDGPRGVILGPCTSFPVAIARAATWDTDLERAVGDAIGAEARAVGANLFGGICINLAPFPGWGRTQESYGEDPVLLGAMGAALTAGVNPWVLSTVKHYACNSMEKARFTVDVTVAEDVLREVYLPHFRTVVESGVDSVMSAYNSVNGQWAGENRHLLTEILRDDWGFAGFVHTDWVFGLRHPVESVAAGQDLEMPLRQQRARSLPAALRDGRLARADVIRAATRIVAAQLRLAVRARPTPSREVIASADHRALARTVAARATVLLRNEPVDGQVVLPLDASSLQRIAVVGRLADTANLGDIGSSKVVPPSTVSALDGLRERLGSRVATATDATPGAAASLAAGADVAVVVVGLSARDEGEALVAMDADAVATLFRRFPGSGLVTRALSAIIGVVGKRASAGDRHDLRLHARDVAVIRAVAAANPRTVVVVIGGGTVVLEPWDRDVAAVLVAWYPGMEGGRALADVLLGDAEPSGRLPLVIPRRQSDLPQVDWSARRVTYGRWWGQRQLDREGVEAAYPFGYGLGYTTMTIADLAVGPVEGERFTAGVTVTNTGARRGHHVVQVYGHLAAQARPVRALLGFQPVALDPGDSSQVAVDCSLRPLQRWTDTGFVLEADTFTVEAGAFSGDPAAVRSSVSSRGG